MAIYVHPLNLSQLSTHAWAIFIASALGFGHSRRGLVRPYLKQSFREKKIHTFTLRLRLPY